MKTIVTDSAEEAASFIRTGDVAAFPTETVYGLGADAYAAEAVRKIFDAKGRPADNPLIVHVASPDQIGALVHSLSPDAESLMDAFFPGPITIVCRKTPRVPEVVTAGLDTVAIRMPGHPVAGAFLDACRTPVAAPSANVSGRPSPTSWQAVLADLDGRIPCILQGGRSPVGLESTVVDCSGEVPIVLRAGAVSLEDLRGVVPSTRLAEPHRSGPPRSPGMTYRHYAPRARVMLVDVPPPELVEDTAFIGLGSAPPGRTGPHVQKCASVEEYAYELYAFFRRCDEAGIRRIYCQRVPETGLGLALMDRLRRAAESVPPTQS